MNDGEFLIKLKMFMIIGTGGFIGTAMRYYVSGYFTRDDFPYGTLVVNVTSSFFLGYKEIVHYFKRNGFSGATVIRGIYGYGKKSQLHSASVLRLSTDLPILIEVVDQKEKIQAVLPEIKKMVKDGLITLEKISIIKHEG